MRVLCCLLVLAASVDLYAQSEQEEFEDGGLLVTFGVQGSVIFPTNLLNVRQAGIVIDDVDFGMRSTNGFSIGGIVQLRLANRLYLQTGINLLRRDYVAYADGQGQSDEVRFRTTTYEIPVMLAYYVRLTDEVAASISAGMPIQALPTDLYAGNDRIGAQSLKLGYIRPVITTMAGAEYRTKTFGRVYLGLVYNIAPWPLFITRITWKGTPPEDRIADIFHVGDYFGLVARYYFE